MFAFARKTILIFLISITLGLLLALPVTAWQFDTNTPSAEADAATPEFAAGLPAVEATEVVVDPPVEEVDDSPAYTPPDAVIEAGTGIASVLERLIERVTLDTPAFAIIATTVVGFLKFIPGATYNETTKRGIHSNTWSLLVIVALWLGQVATELLGYRERYNGYLVQAADILPSLLGFVGTLFGARFLHEQAAKRDIAVLGTKTANRMPTPGVYVNPATGVVSVQGRVDISGLAEDEWTAPTTRFVPPEDNAA